MNTASRLRLVLFITVLFGLFSIFTVLQLSKATQFHRLNILHIYDVIDLQKQIESHPEIPLKKSNITKTIGHLKSHSEECLSIINVIDRLTLNLIGAIDTILLCEKDVQLENQLLNDLDSYNSEIIMDEALIEKIKNAGYKLKYNSDKFILPVEKIGKFTINLAIWLIIPFSIFVILLSIFMFRKIRRKNQHLHKAIIELERSKEEKQQLAYYDSLTGLANRNLFIEIFEHEIEQVKRYNSSFSLLYIDLDRFKFINDSLGHEAGDDLLKQVSKRLKKYNRKSDTLCRFGGDEFLLILSGPDSSKYSFLVAQKIIDAISQPFQIDGHDMYISASIGIAYCPDDGTDSKTLIKRADIAMYEAKSNGKNQYCAYEEDKINHKTERLLSLEKDLRYAIEREQLEIHYQPVIDLNSMNTIGAEALLRWKHHEHGMVSPEEFIPIAEENGMIIEIGDWVIEQACKQCKIWRETENLNFHIAINVSGLQLKNKDLPGFIEKNLLQNSLSPEAIDIEITESAFYSEDIRSIKNLDKLSNMGLRLLLDDFGTGYSSLSTLNDLSFDIIKIDRSFMDVRNASRHMMIQTIIDMASNFGMKTVAEGVEDLETINFLRELNCDYAQGFYFQKPVSANELDINKNYKVDIEEVKSVINA